MKSDAPERIWIDRHDIETVSEQSQFDPDYIEYIRADKHNEAVREARKEVWNAAMLTVQSLPDQNYDYRGFTTKDAKDFKCNAIESLSAARDAKATTDGGEG